MTTCGYFWTIVVIVLAVVAVAVSAVRGEKSGKPTPHPALRPPSPQGEGKREAEAGPRAYRRGGARYVSCSASTRLDEGYIVGLGGRSGDDPGKMISYAKKELAAILAEQALAAGGIEFTVDGWELRAFMRTVTGREGDTSSGAAAADELGMSRRASGSSPQGEGKALGEAPRPQGEGKRAEAEP